MSSFSSIFFNNYFFLDATPLFYNSRKLVKTYTYRQRVRCGRMVVEFTTTFCVPVQSVSITTNVVSLKHTHGMVYSIQHYMIKFVSDLQQVWFSADTLASCTNKTDHNDIHFV